MNIVFMGTPDFAVPTLEKLNKYGYEIKLVITQPDKPKGRGKKLSPTPVKIKAQELDIEVFQPKNVNDDKSIFKIKSLQPDFIVVVAYGQILRQQILDASKYGCINVHASLLPLYRGAAPINWAIINGEEKTGVTTMFMEKGLDTGDMLLKREIKINKEETAGELHDKLMHIGADVLIETLNGIVENKIKPIPQDNNKSSYAKMLDKTLGHIDWNKRAIDIKNLIRGTNPWPGAYFKYNSKKIKVYDVDICDDMIQGKNGQVLKVNQNGICIKTCDKSLLIKELQFPGKRRMKVEEFLRGNDFEVGIILK